MAIYPIGSAIYIFLFYRKLEPKRFHSNLRLYDDALTEMIGLHIIQNSPTKLTLNSIFKASLRQAVTGGVVSRGTTRHPVAIDTLDGYALERWETILHYMVSSGQGQLPTKPSQGVLYLLQRSELMKSVHGSPLQITSSGFQFLLHSPHDQLWSLLLQYLHMAEERQMDLVEVLSFLFMLSTMELGREYSTDPLSETQKAMLEDLRDYGLVWQRKASSKRFSPTRLATTLTSLSPPLPTSRYMRTRVKLWSLPTPSTTLTCRLLDNPLEIAVLNLFITMKYRFPNLVVGMLTRESVRKALSNGISADQIISYLTTHAHPQMRKNNPLLPVTVQDQIRLWELERNRLKSAEGFLYKDFASQADYEYVLSYAKQLGVVLWENTVKRAFFGTLEGHANIRGFIERRTGGG
ncbi:transcription factor Tfb2, partial [Butyriboletus roseoflavus]